MPIEDIYEVIIVGGGPAGLTAGIYSKRAGLKTVLFERGLVGGQIAVSKEVDNYPGVQGITGFDLAEKLSHHAGTFNLDIVQQEVAAIHAGTDLHAVTLADGSVVRTVALILALGGTARKLGVPGEAEYFGSGVSYCATCDGFFFRDKIVAVVGGGDGAVEEAIHLARLTKKVYLVHRRDSLRANRALQDRLAAESRIGPLWNTVVTEIKGDGRTVTDLTLENTQTGERRELAVDGIFIRIGYYPNNQLIPEGVLINDQGFVITDQKCETTIPGVFVAGDLRQKYANQIVVAAADGCIAALAAAHHVETRRERVGAK